MRGSRGSKRGSYVRNVIGEIFPLPRLAASHVIDNSAMPALTENVGVSKKTEHFARWLLHLRHQVQNGLTFVHLCRTFDMHADGFTKVTDRDSQWKLVKLGCNS